MGLSWLEIMSVIATLIAGIGGAYFGGRLAANGAAEAVRVTLSSLEDQELRKLRVKCIYELIAHRYVLQDPEKRDWAEKRPFNASLNAVTALWAGDQAALSKVRVLRNGASNLALYELVNYLGKTAGLDLSALNADDFENVMTI